MEMFSEKLAEICTEVINNPESNISRIGEVLSMTKKLKEDDTGLALLSLAKVFKNIVPLYKVRIHSDVVKHKSQNIKVSIFDKCLFSQYNVYIKELCNSELPESYKAAAELLRTVDHFNFSDRIVAKVLRGSSLSHPVSKLCLEVLVDRIKNDIIGDTIFIIIDKCLDCRFNHLLVEALIDSKYLEKCVQIRIEKEEYYNKQRIEERKRAKREIFGKGFFAKKRIIDKKEKKEEKTRLKLQSEVRGVEEGEISAINEKNYVKTVNALQRLYFTILKEKYTNCNKSVYIGVRKYIKIIRKEFHEGLYTLLVGSIRDCYDKCVSSLREYKEFELAYYNNYILASLEGMSTIFEIYGQNGIDFKRILDVYFYIVHPTNFHTNISDFELVSFIGRCFFIRIEQPKQRIVALLQRLMVTRSLRFIPVLDLFIKDLEVKYDIDFSDHEIKSRNAYDSDVSDIDNVPNKPFYEYFLYKKMQ